MRRILDRDLAILEKVQTRKYKPEDLKKLELAQSRVLKIMDKLHASKQSLGGDKENPIIIQVAKEVAEQNGISEVK